MGEYEKEKVMKKEMVERKMREMIEKKMRGMEEIGEKF